MSLGSEKIDETKSMGSTAIDYKENNMLEHSNKDSSTDKRADDQQSAINKMTESEKVDNDSKKIETTASSISMKPAPANNNNTASTNGLAPTLIQSTTSTYNRKVLQTPETDKRRIDSDIVHNHNNNKTDNPLAANRETPSSLSTGNNYHTSSGTNSYNGSRRSESSITDAQSHPHEQRRSTVENLSKTNLYIRGLTPNTTDEDLYNMCVRYGDILSTKAILDKANGCCRGYGFVQYATARSAEVAVVELTKGGIQAQMARVPSNHPPHSQRYAYHKGSNNHSHYQNQYQHQHHGGHSNLHGGGLHNTMNPPHNTSSHNHINSNISDPTNLYLANLPLNMSEVELDTLLSSFGPVVSTRILRDERQNSRGVGFARMETRDKCQEIIESLNKTHYKGSVEPLLIKFADDGNRKRHNYNNHHSNNNNHHHHHVANNLHHKLNVNDDENRWRDGGDRVDQNVNPSIYEHQRNIPHGDQMSDMSMMGHMSYPRMQPTFPPAMSANAAYPPTLGPPTSQAQWLHPGSGQTWNVIPQHMMQPNNLGPSNQASVPANFPFGHMSQLATQMQGLHLGHHSGGPMSGYIPPQWSPVWPHPMSPPQQAQSQQIRLSGPVQASGALAQQIPQVPEAAPTFMSNQEACPITASKQNNLSDTNKQISAPL